MAKILSLLDIQTGEAIEAQHVSQSIIAFTGAEAYDITLSGSFVMQGPLTGTPGLINSFTSSYAITASYVENAPASDTASFVTGSNVYGPYGSNSIISSSHAQTSSFAEDAISSSYALTSSYAVTASFVEGSGIFPFVGDAVITGSLVVSASNQTQALQLYGSGSTIFSIEGSRGTLFTIDDDESDGTLFSVNNVSGTPILEVQEDNTVKLGKQNGFGIVISGSNPAPNDLDANIIITGSIKNVGSSAYFDTNITASGNVSASGFISASSFNAPPGVINQLTASYAISASVEVRKEVSSSYADTASYVETAQTASFVTTAQTASYVTTAQTSSYILASNIDQPFTNITASGNISASGYISASSFAGDGSGLTGVISNPFPYIGIAEITGSLRVSGSFYLDYNGGKNIIIGSGSAETLTTGISNIVIGNNAATSLSSGTGNIILGDEAGVGSDFNDENNVIAIGLNAGKNTDFDSNLGDSILIGKNAGRTGNSQNTVAIGTDSGYADNSTYNVLVGFETKGDGTNNVGLGYTAFGNGLHNYSVAIGSAALNGVSSTNSTGNVAIGYQSFRNPDGNDSNYNISIGYQAYGINKITSEGIKNIVLGYKVVPNFFSGSNNIVIGDEAGNELVDGSNNIIIGQVAASGSGDSSDKLFIGSGSFAIISGSLLTGDLIFKNSASAQYFSAPELIINDLTASYAITASHALNSSSPTLQEVTDTGPITTTPITASIISSSANIIAQSFTGSLSGSALEAISSSFAQTASYVTTAQTASFVTLAQTASFITGSNVYGPHGSNSIISSSNAQTASFVTGSNVYGTVTSASYALTASYAVSASFEIIKEVSSSYADTASYVETAQTASFVTLAQTASFVTTAQTASFITGSNVYGPYDSNSVISSSHAVTASYADTASFIEKVPTSDTASFVTSSNVHGPLGPDSIENAQTASYVETAQTASYVTTAQTASFVTTAQTASFITTAQTASFITGSNVYGPHGSNSVISSSHAISSSFALTASFIEKVPTADTASFITGSNVYGPYGSNSIISSSNAQTASYVETAQTASYVENAQTASYVETAQTASYVLNAVSASYALSASFAQTASYIASASYTPNLQEVTDAGSDTTTPITASIISASGIIFSSASIIEGDIAELTFKKAGFVAGAVKTSGSSLIFDGTSGIERARFLSTGQFGIGTTTPSEKLTVGGNISASGDIIGNTGSFLAGTFTGNVGIGTTIGEDGARLNVRGTSSISADAFGRIEIIPVTGDGQTAVIKQTMDFPRNGGNLQIQVDKYVKGGNLYFATDGNNKRMTVSSSGDVGIGTTSPGERLEVIGNVSASGNLFANVTDNSDTNFKTVMYDTVIGQFFSTGSYGGGGGDVENADTASFVTSSNVHGPLGPDSIENAQTASFVTTAQTASYVENAQTASFITTAQTASYVENAQTASFVTTAQTASFVTTAQTSSFVTGSNVYGPHGSNSVISSSHAITASFVLTASYVASASYIPNLQQVTDSGKETTNIISASGYDLPNGGNIISNGVLNIEQEKFSSEVNFLNPINNTVNIKFGDSTDTIFSTNNQFQKGNITASNLIYSENNIIADSDISATDGNIFTQNINSKISSSGELYFSSSKDNNDQFQRVVQDTSTGKLYITGEKANDFDGDVDVKGPDGKGAKITVGGSNESGSVNVGNNGSFIFGDTKGGLTGADIDGEINVLKADNVTKGKINLQTLQAGTNTTIIDDNIATTGDITLTGSLHAKTNITASGNISASGNLIVNVADNSTTTFKTVMYDTTTGQFFRTGSYGGGGSGTTPNLDQVTTQGNTTTNNITAGIISGSAFKLNNLNALSFSNNILSVGNAGGWTQIELGRETTDEIHVNGILKAEQRIIAESDITASGNISASGNLLANLPFTSDTTFKTVVVDPITGLFSRTGSYGSGGSGTVTSITAGDGLAGGTITNSGTIDVDTTVVRTTGAQDIAGVKTFKSDVIVSGSRPVTIKGSGQITIRGALAGTYANAYNFLGSTGTAFGGFGLLGTANASSYFYIGAAYNAANILVLKTDTGNVGIGTTSPQTKLHISNGTDSDSGNIQLTIGGTSGTNARTGGIIKNTSSPYEMTIRSSNLATSTQALILNDTGGNVGIGTTSPDSKLELIGDYKQKATDGNSQGFTLSINPSTDAVSLNNYYNASMTFSTNNSAKMTILGSGNVGIGTTSPGEKLEVIGNISASGNLFADLADDSTSTFKTVVYDTTSGKFFRTGSYSGGGGGATPDLQEVTTEGKSTSLEISSSVGYALPSGGNITSNGTLNIVQENPTKPNNVININNPSNNVNITSPTLIYDGGTPGTFQIRFNPELGDYSTKFTNGLLDQKGTIQATNTIATTAGASSKISSSGAMYFKPDVNNTKTFQNVVMNTATGRLHVTGNSSGVVDDDFEVIDGKNIELAGGGGEIGFKRADDSVGTTITENSITTGTGTTIIDDNVRSTGYISASGDLIGNTLSLKSSTSETGFKFSENAEVPGELDLQQSDGTGFGKFYIKSDTVEIPGLLDAKGNVKLGNDPTFNSDTITIQGHITASGNMTLTGNVSASGNVFGNRVVASSYITAVDYVQANNFVGSGANLTGVRTIATKEEGSSVDTQTSTLNFTGNAVNLSAAGGGSVNVAINTFPPTQTITSNTTLSSADVGFYNIITHTANLTITISPTGLTAGDEFYFFNASAANDRYVTFDDNEGANTIICASSTPLRLKKSTNSTGQGAYATLKFISGTTFHLYGDID